MQTKQTVSERRAISGELVAYVAAGLIALQLIFRGWSSFNGWFYEDDLVFLNMFSGQPFSWSEIFAPYDAQFMPGGLATAWLVANSGSFAWPAAALALTFFQLIANLTCAWMLFSLFGKRWLTVIVLSFYLFSTMTLTAFMWWASALNQLPAHAAFFAAVALHVKFLRSGHWRWLLAAAVALTLGELFYVKVALYVVPIALLTLIWFVPRGPGWFFRAIRSHWKPLLVYGVSTVAYAALYLWHVPSPFVAEKIEWFDLAASMFGRSLPSVLLGGPWHWTWQIDPAGQVGVSLAAGLLLWVAIATALYLGHRRGRITLWALLIPLPYLAMTYVLTAQGRGMLGGYIGLELRYLADAAPVITLAIGVALMPLIGATSGPLDSPRRAARPVAADPKARLALAVVAVAAVVGVVVSNLSYVVQWHDYPQRAYLTTAIDSFDREPARVVDAPVPVSVINVLGHPRNVPSFLFAPLGEQVIAVDAGTDLLTLALDGSPSPVEVTGRRLQTLPGEITGCGTIVRGDVVPLRYSGSLPAWDWWVLVRYLAENDGLATITTEDGSTEFEVRSGAHTYLMSGSGPVGALSIQGQAENGLCLDSIAIGKISAVKDSQ